jgi:hypothetical protein
MTKFRKGESGNPAGRPKGSGLSGRLRQAIEKDSEAILAALIDQAKTGDVQAARILLDRVCPSLKAQAQPVEVEGLAAGGLVERATAALDAAANGNIAPDVAAGLVAAVGTLARVAEIEDLEKRLQALERAQEAKP